MKYFRLSLDRFPVRIFGYFFIRSFEAVASKLNTFTSNFPSEFFALCQFKRSFVRYKLVPFDVKGASQNFFRSRVASSVLLILHVSVPYANTLSTVAANNLHLSRGFMSGFRNEMFKPIRNRTITRRIEPTDIEKREEEAKDSETAAKTRGIIKEDSDPQVFHHGAGKKKKKE